MLLLYIILLLLLILVLCNSVTYKTINKCPKGPIKIPYMRASKLPSVFNWNVEGLGINTINFKLDQNTPCGIYKLTTAYGYGTLYVGSNPTIGSLLLSDAEAIKKVDMIDMWDIERLTPNNNIIIQTYYNGCCP